MEIDFEKNMNKPNSDFVILDAFGQCEGLDRFRRCLGMCLDAWNQLNRAKTQAASSL